MQQQRKSARADVTGLKWFISSAALAATIGGWGWLTTQNPPLMDIAATTPNIVIEEPLVERQPLPNWLVQAPGIPVLPTVAPLNIPERPAAAPAPAPAAASAPAPAAAPAPAPALREVSVPAPAPRPAPAARTRSSR
ncbi:hypothetical protein [Chloroflexus sp.]|uniref:hypothetical protein n=1 Tax=Chloroflexus sp. TaxID=1904827 RepID=UPI003D135418